MSAELKPRDHNRPPIEAPSPVDAQTEMKTKYPDVEKRCEELLKSAATVPATIDDEETAKDVQTLLKEMTASMGSWKAHRTDEKGPWQKVADTVYAFFTTPLERVKKSHDDIKSRLTKYQEVVREQERQAREEKARKEREEAEKARAAAEEARRRKEQAETEAKAAAEREAEARRKAEEAERERAAAEERAAKAKEEELRLAREKKERDDATKRQLTERLGILRTMALDLERLEAKHVAGTLDIDEDERLEDLLSQTGNMALCAWPILMNIDLLEPVQNAQFTAIRSRRDTLRAEHTRRQDAAKRKAEEEAERKAQEDAAARRKEREAEEARLAEARRQREDEEAKLAAAKAAQKEATKDARAARSERQSAESGVKGAAKDEKAADTIAGKTEARADRLDRAASGATDADLTRLRSEHGTVGSLTGRWEVASVDVATVPLEVLREFMMPGAIEAAVYRFMRANQGNWHGREIVKDALEGCVFERVPDTRIK